jgi:pimeloyl-ACP methyl ester carboxylesterase
MFFLPTSILAAWLLGLLSLAIVVAGPWLLYAWYDRAWVLERVRVEDRIVERWAFDPQLGMNPPTAMLVAGVALIAWALLGGLIVRLFLALTSKSKGGGESTDHPGPLPAPRTMRLRRPDGAELHVELYGPDEAPPLVLTHGWGVNADEWIDLKRRLAGRFRLIAWDLPGLGRSRRPDNKDFRLEAFAGHLDAVLALAGDRPAVLVGHSIGGMTSLTFCKLHPEALGTRVAGLVLAETTYTNPVRTAKNAEFYTALEKPVLVPLLHLTIWLWPFVWLMNILGYLNGTSHMQSRQSGFGGTETPEQVDFATRFNLQAPPDVLARGMFGMLHYDATTALDRITVPVLVVSGDRDPNCPPDRAGRPIAAAVPRGTMELLSPARHMGHMEHCDRFATLVAEFAESCQTAVSGRAV